MTNLKPLGVSAHGAPLIYCACGMAPMKYCVHELSGLRSGESCGAPLCQRCATPQGRGKEPGVCSVHAPKTAAWDPTQVPPRRS